MADDGPHVRLTVREPLPIAAAAGDDVTLLVRAACPAGHDRRHLSIAVTAPGGETTMHAFARHADGISEVDVVLTAPVRVGEHVLRLTLAPHDVAGTQYPQAELAVPLAVRPQAASLAVWEVPSPVVAGMRFGIKAGATSTARCSLAGRTIEVCDGGGAVVARGMLGDAPLPGTSALYWSEIALAAPTEIGVTSWSVRFAGAGLALPHDDAATTFSLAVEPAPAHRLTVKVVEAETAAPIADVELRLGAYRGTTGASGLAEIALPKGCYELNIWKVGYEAPARPVEIAADAFVEIAAAAVPEEDPDARWRM